MKQHLKESYLKHDYQSISKEDKERGRILLEEHYHIKRDNSVFEHCGNIHDFQTKYNKFVSKYSDVAKVLSRAQPDGVGPCEILCYYIFDNIGVGGKNSKIDFYKDGKEFAEAKGGKQNKKRGIVFDFKMSRDSDKAVVNIRKHLENFNDGYKSLKGEALPGWKSSASIPMSVIDDWQKIDLKELSKESKSLKSVDLRLTDTGDIFIKNNEKPVLNIKKEKSLDVILDLLKISNEKKIAKFGSLEDIVDHWKEDVLDEYAKGKEFCIFDIAKMEMVFAGKVSKNNLVLTHIHRSQPWAGIKI